MHNVVSLSSLPSCLICPIKTIALVDANEDKVAPVMRFNESNLVGNTPYHKVPSRITIRALPEPSRDIDFVLYWDGMAAASASVVRTDASSAILVMAEMPLHDADFFLASQGHHTLSAVVFVREKEPCVCSRAVHVE